MYKGVQKDNNIDDSVVSQKIQKFTNNIYLTIVSSPAWENYK